VVSVPQAGAPEPESLVSPPVAAAAIERLDAAAKLAGISLRLEPDTFLPPCVFSHPGRLTHLYALTPGGGQRTGYTQVERCSECVVADRCPGFSEATLEREPGLTAVPLREDRVRRQLTVISSVREQIDRELVTREIWRSGRAVVPTPPYHINFSLQPSLPLPFVSTHLPAPADEAV
jgi:hypothetical protein